MLPSKLSTTHVYLRPTFFSKHKLLVSSLIYLTSSLQLEKKGSKTGQFSRPYWVISSRRHSRAAACRTVWHRGPQWHWGIFIEWPLPVHLLAILVRLWAHEGIMITVFGISQQPAQGFGKYKMVNRFLMKQWNEEELTSKNDCLLARLRACIWFLLLNTPGLLYSHRPHNTCLSPKRTSTSI